MGNKKSSGTGTEGTWAARRIGYVVAIAFMFVFLYILINLYDWGVPYITEEYNDLIWYIELSIYASIIAHAIFLVYDPKWFRYLLKAITGVFSSLATIMFYVVFPFDFPGNFNKIGKIILLVLVVLSVIGIIVELVKAIRFMVRSDS